MLLISVEGRGFNPAVRLAFSSGVLTPEVQRSFFVDGGSVGLQAHENAAQSSQGFSPGGSSPRDGFVAVGTRHVEDPALRGRARVSAAAARLGFVKSHNRRESFRRGAAGFLCPTPTAAWKSGALATTRNLGAGTAGVPGAPILGVGVAVAEAKPRSDHCPTPRSRRGLSETKSNGAKKKLIATQVNSKRAPSY